MQEPRFLKHPENRLLFFVTYKNQETPEKETETASLLLILQCQITSGCKIPEDYLFADCWKTETESPIGESQPHNGRGGVVADHVLNLEPETLRNNTDSFKKWPHLIKSCQG
ncbi:hypothetical protein EK904_007983, partial [Melospiza melodia maxima]